jgi:phosphate transport system substrate-binding protein
MTAAPGAIVRRGGISTTIFIITIVVVAAVSGTVGYVIPGLLHPGASTYTLNGAGSTFVNPLLTAINTNYTKLNSNIQINYQAVGSGTGINFLGTRTVDFGASDAPLSNTQLVQVPNALTIPDTIGAVVIAYNIPINSTYSVHKGLYLNVTVAAKIFQGDITVWNDPAILALNQNNPNLQGVSLPGSQITVVHRSDSSGTTFVFSGYLNSTSVWRGGQSKTITKWATGSIGANGNQGVAAVLQGTSNTVGYVELNYALSTSPPISYAFLWNPTGNSFIAPTLSSTGLAATSLSTLPAGNGNWQTINLLNSNNSGAYPIVTFSYIMVYQELNVYGSAMTQARAQTLVNYLWFVVHDGQNQATPLSFVALPSNVVTNAETTIRSITYNGSTLHS